MSPESEAASWRTFKTFFSRWLRAALLFAGIGCVAGIAAFLVFPSVVPAGDSLGDKLQGVSAALMMYTSMHLYETLETLGLDRLEDYLLDSFGDTYSGFLIAAFSHAAAGLVMGGALYPLFRLGMLVLQFRARASDGQGTKSKQT